MTFTCLVFVSVNNSAEINAAGAFSITYNGNGSTDGTVPNDTNVYAENQIATVLGNEGDLRKTGYLFSGWNTESDGSGTTYKEDGSITVTDNVTLYAVWTPVITTQPTKDNDYKLVVNTSLLSTYNVFYEWYKENPTEPILCTNTYTGEISFPSDWTLESANYYCKIKLTEKANPSLYCTFDSDPIYPKEISFDGNDATSGSDPATMYQFEGRKVTMPSNTYSKEGYQFLGWSADWSASEPTTFTDNKCTVGPDSVIYYAIWQRIVKADPTKDNDYAVTLQNGITNASYQWQESDYEWGFSYVYFCNYNNGRTLDSDMTWLSKNCYFEIGNAKAIRFKYAGTSTITNCTENADGYYYPPYNEATGVYDLTASSSDNDNPITDIEVYTVGFSYTPVTGQTSSKLNLTSLENKGYRCYVTLASGEKGYSETVMPKSITFDGNGSTGGTGTTLYQLEGRNIQLPSCPFTKTGYSFVGWNTDKNATSGLSSVVMGSTDTTLYAIWQVNSSQNDSGYKVVNTSTTGNNYSLKLVSLLSMAMAAGIVISKKKKH